MSTYSPISIRDPATIFPQPPPEHYSFLGGPITARKYRANFRHPSYPNDSPLFTLYAWDSPGGGIHHGLAHSACAIIANNRIDGYLSRACGGEGQPIDAGWDEVLPTEDTDYYFYVPHPLGTDTEAAQPTSSSLPRNAETSSPSRPPYRWPIVTNFQDWEFSNALPEVWARCHDMPAPLSNIAPQSNFTSAIQQRDIKCRVTAFSSGTEVAHLIPEHEKYWFALNGMASWNTDLTLDSEHLLRDLGNAVLLRSDIHTAFDQRKFVFFPKASDKFVLHMLEPTLDIGQIYHNVPVDIPYCKLEFLFARFAWSIFPSLAGFLSKPNKKRLVVRLGRETGGYTEEEISDSVALGRIASASRSTSPTKRSRTRAGLDDDQLYASSATKRRCQGLSNDISTPSPALSFGSSQAALPLDELTKHPNRAPSLDVRLHGVGSQDQDVFLENEYHRELRGEALIKQRPLGFDPNRPPYDRHRPAIEELEIMGVEILDSPEQ